MNSEDLSHLIYEKGPRGAVKHCIESGEHRKGTPYQIGRFVGISFLIGTLIFGLLVGLGLLLAVGILGTLGTLGGL